MTAFIVVHTLLQLGMVWRILDDKDVPPYGGWPLLVHAGLVAWGVWLLLPTLARWLP